LQQDKDATRVWYGRDVPFSDILKGEAKTDNEDARAFVSAVQNAKETAQAHIKGLTVCGFAVYRSDRVKS
jgi:hypothetical protein